MRLEEKIVTDHSLGMLQKKNIQIQFVSFEVVVLVGGFLLLFQKEKENKNEQSEQKRRRI